jgi:hypothetical protein
MAAELLRAFLQQASATGTRSTVLSDLRWFFAIVISALLVGLKVNAPLWILILLACFAGLIALIYLASYIYFGLRNPDALRSEKFTLSKLAIERSVVGDNLSGFIDPAIDAHALNLPSTTPKKEDL